MQSGVSNQGIIVFADNNCSFNRNLLTLVKHWDKRGNIHIFPSPQLIGMLKQEVRTYPQSNLLAVDEDGVNWTGAEAVPIIFKNLPFGKLAAAAYILPGIMWLTRRLYEAGSR